MVIAHAGLIGLAIELAIIPFGIYLLWSGRRKKRDRDKGSFRETSEPPRTPPPPP